MLKNKNVSPLFSLKIICVEGTNGEKRLGKEQGGERKQKERKVRVYLKGYSVWRDKDLSTT